jgi:hypothetical protein
MYTTVRRHASAEADRRNFGGTKAGGETQCLEEARLSSGVAATQVDLGGDSGSGVEWEEKVG